MKILHIIPAYLPAYRYGGPIKTVHELNKWLVKKGVDVTVYTTNIDGPDDLNVLLGQEANIDGVKVFYFHGSHNLFLRKWFYSSALRFALSQNLSDFDIIHITSVFLFASTLGAYYAKKFKKPYIISPRGSLMIEPLAKKILKKKTYLSLIEKRNLIGAAAIHFTANMEKEEYLKASLPLKKAIMIPNSFDIEEFNIITRDSIEFRKKFNISADKKIILFLSRMNWKKGLDTLIPAFMEVIKKEQRAVLVLAGPDENNYTENLKSQISNLEISDKVIFTGMLLGNDKIAAYRESDVFVLPSYSENFGMAIVEAMVARKPIVITKGVGIANEVEKSGAGLVVEKDVKQVSEAILKILNNPDLAKKMGENSRQLVEAEFSGEKVAEKWIKEYNEIIKNV